MVTLIACGQLLPKPTRPGWTVWLPHGSSSGVPASCPPPLHLHSPERPRVEPQLHRQKQRGSSARPVRSPQSIDSQVHQHKHGVQRRKVAILCSPQPVRPSPTLPSGECSDFLTSPCKKINRPSHGQQGPKGAVASSSTATTFFWIEP